MSSFSTANLRGGNSPDGGDGATPVRRAPNSRNAGVTPRAGGQFFYDDDEPTPERRAPNKLNAGVTPRAAGGKPVGFNAETRFDDDDVDGAADGAGGEDDSEGHKPLRRRKSFEQHRLEEKLHSSDRFERAEAQAQLDALKKEQQERAKLGRSLTRGGSMHRRGGAAHKDHGHISSRATMVKILHHGHDHHKYPWTIEPYNRYRRYFDVVTVIFVLYLAWKIPFAAGLSWYVTPPGVKTFEYCLDGWFVIDIILNFRTGFVHDGHVVMDPHEIAKHYFHFWFWIDALASIPFELFAEFIPNKTARKSIKLVKYFKIPRLLRLGRMLKYLRKWAKYYGLMCVCLGYVLSIHMFGTLWVSNAGICEHEDELHVDNDPREAYLDLDYAGECSQEAHWLAHWYGKALQKGVQMLLGTSPVPAMQAEQRSGEVAYEYNELAMAVYVGIVMSIGVFFVSAFVAQLTVIVMHTNTTVWQYRMRNNQVKRELAAHHLPTGVQKRVRAYLDYLWINRENLQKSTILTDERLSHTLRNDIALHVYEEVVMNVSWLRFAEEDLVAKICMDLNTVVFMPGDWVFRKGDVGRKLFIVKKGYAEVVEDEYANPVKVLAKVEKGGVFGEIALLHRKEGKRLKSVRAGEFPCECVTLDKVKFDRVRREYPEFDKKMKEIATRHNRGSVFTSVNGGLPGLDRNILSKFTMVEDEDDDRGGRKRMGLGAAAGPPAGSGVQLMEQIDERLREHTEELDAKLEAIMRAVGATEM